MYLLSTITQKQENLKAATILQVNFITLAIPWKNIKINNQKEII